MHDWVSKFRQKIYGHNKDPLKDHKARAKKIMHYKTKTNILNLNPKKLEITDVTTKKQAPWKAPNQPQSRTKALSPEPQDQGKLNTAISSKLREM